MKQSSGAAPSSSRVAAMALIGTSIEWYDFFAFSTASALVFNQIFFTDASPLIGTMLALSTFAVGFVARPFGAAICGHIGDRHGRKKVLVATLIIMGVSTFAVGLLPTYQQIGAWAPAMLVTLRIIQGCAVGGEFGGAVVMAYEHAKPRKKALLGAMAPLGSPIGLLISSCVWFAITALPQTEMLAWGWRIPFLLSIVLVPIGLLIRNKLPETRDFQESAKARAPIALLFTQHWRALLIGIFGYAGSFALYYLMTTFVLVYANETLRMPGNLSVPAQIFGAIAQLAFILAGALAASYIPARKVAITAGIGLTVWAFPAFGLVNTAVPALLYTAVIVAMCFDGMSVGVRASEVSNLFPAKVRYTGMSLSYQIAGVLGGGLSPILATWLLSVTEGNVWVIAGYATIIAIPVIICSWLLPKRSVPSAEADQVESVMSDPAR